MDEITRRFNPIPISDVDIDGDGKTYVVENGVKINQICGSKLPNKKGYVCGNNGEVLINNKCKLHAVKSGVKYWERLNEELQLPSNLKGLYEKAEGIDRDDLLSVPNLLRRVSVLYWSVLGKPLGKRLDKDGQEEVFHTPVQLEYLRKMDTLCLQVIESDRRVENRTLLKAQFISKIIESIFSVVNRNVSPETAKVIVGQIGELVFAYHEEGKIKGDIDDIQDKVKNLTEIKSEGDDFVIK